MSKKIEIKICGECPYMMRTETKLYHNLFSEAPIIKQKYQCGYFYLHKKGRIDFIIEEGLELKPTSFNGIRKDCPL